MKKILLCMLLVFAGCKDCRKDESGYYAEAVVVQRLETACVAVVSHPQGVAMVVVPCSNEKE